MLAYTDISTEIVSGSGNITANSIYGYIHNNHVHIEAQLTVNSDITSETSLLAMPKKYGLDNLKCGSAIIASSDRTIKALAYARVVVSISGNYAVFTQRQTNTVTSGSVVGLSIDYMLS